jgi:hypothetical protein
MPLLLTNCKKDPQLEKPPTKLALLKGAWTERSLLKTFYDASGTKVFEEPFETGKITFDGNSVVTAIYPGRDIEKGKYSLTTQASTTYLRVENATDTLVYTIVSINKTSLQLTLQTENDSYIAADAECILAKSILTSTMTKN